MNHLNTYRTNHNCNLKNQLNFDNLCELLLIILDFAHKEMDTSNALKILVFSNNFFVENKDLSSKSYMKPRIYLQDGLANHEIW
jgi:hypothetical protein